MISLWRKRPFLTTAFLMVCAVSLFFAGRIRRWRWNPG